MSIDHSTLTLDQLENMSDEDFKKLDPSQFPDEAPEPEQEVENTSTPEQVEQTQATEQVEDETQTPNPDEAEQPNEAVPNGTASEAEQAQAGTELNEGGEGATEVTPEQTATEVTAEKAFFDKVTAEFNANGKSFKIDSADDVVSLMQKGLNYNQKMAQMKPGMKVLKALQEQGIESVEDLGFLLDLKAKKPEAIARLIQESGIDAYELNEEKSQAYQPSVPQVSDELVNFEMTAKSLEGNPHFGTVVQQLGTYDEHTKQEIFKNPHLLNLLTDHVQNGFYDKICARLEQEQAVGRLNGMSFLQAYDTVGNMLFGQQQQAQPAVQPVVNTAPVVTPVATPVASKPKPSNNAARQAAAGNTGSATQVQQYTFTPEDIWNMSAEEFAKIDPKFL